ncbi:MAG: hydrogenase maturation protease [Syntrophomonadaceae bacterium]|nr:hydrogenase maturation protease [Syntrophomonadaceae bacterium]
MNKLMVVGIGNYILQDEGVGVHAINRLMEMDLPDGVELVDGGTHSYDLVDFFCQAENLIIIDAMQAGGEPGTMYRAPLEELGLRPQENCTSLHEMHFIEAVKMVNMMGHYPKIIVYGIEPEVIDWGMELTPRIEEKLPRLTELVAEEIRALMAE